jgi:hypothetical protein
MNIATIIAAHLIIGASNHAAGIGFCTCAREPVPLQLPHWRAVEPVPVHRPSNEWIAKRVDPIPLVHRR